jgi:hypothetical protein
MQIEVESIAEPISIARKMLALNVAAESFAWLSDVIRAVVMRVPPGRSAEPNRTCSVVVVLRDGQRFDALAVADNVTDALERACHEARRDIAAAIGRPLRRRRTVEVSVVNEHGEERRVASRN